MRYIRYLFLACVAIILLTLAMANRQLVNLTLLPEDMARFAGETPSIELPLFAVILASIVAGILIGFIWEWLRELKYRTAASRERTEKNRLAKEVDRLRGPAQGDPDDVLALLEDGQATR